MIAYHNDENFKKNILAKIKIGEYFSIDFNDVIITKSKLSQDGHFLFEIDYEKSFGIPEILRDVADRICDRLPLNLKEELPYRFMSSINVGSDLSKVWNKFVVFFLGDPEHGIINLIPSSESKLPIQDVIDLYKTSLTEEITDIQRRNLFKNCLNASINYTLNSYIVEDSVKHSYQVAAHAAVNEFYSSVILNVFCYETLANALIQLISDER